MYHIQTLHVLLMLLFFEVSVQQPLLLSCFYPDQFFHGFNRHVRAPAIADRLQFNICFQKQSVNSSQRSGHIIIIYELDDDVELAKDFICCICTSGSDQW